MGVTKPSRPPPSVTRSPPDETAFINARGSFYLATTNRGGQPGFLKVVSRAKTSCS